MFTAILASLLVFWFPRSEEPPPVGRDTLRLTIEITMKANQPGEPVSTSLVEIDGTSARLTRTDTGFEAPPRPEFKLETMLTDAEIGRLRALIRSQRLARDGVKTFPAVGQDAEVMLDIRLRVELDGKRAETTLTGSAISKKIRRDPFFRRVNALVNEVEKMLRGRDPKVRL